MRVCGTNEASRGGSVLVVVVAVGCGVAGVGCCSVNLSLGKPAFVCHTSGSTGPSKLFAKYPNTHYKTTIQQQFNKLNNNHHQHQIKLCVTLDSKTKLAYFSV